MGGMGLRGLNLGRRLDDLTASYSEKMKIEELPELLRYLVETFSLWMRCIKSPFKTADELLSADVSDTSRFRAAGRLWTISFLLNFTLQLPLYKGIGIGLADVEFLIPVIALTLGITAVSCASVTAGLRYSGAPVKWQDIFSLQTVFGAAYSPLLSLAQYGRTASFFFRVRELQAQHLRPADLVRRFMATTPTNPFSTAVNVLAEIIAPFFLLMFFVSMGALAQRVAAHYKVDKARVISGIALGYGLLFPLPLLFFVGMICIVFFASLK